MRIVAGRFRGMRLVAPTGRATRPSSDRLRETLFDILAHRFALPHETTRVLDLFAGTGALGLEAMSRGAAFALFVDNEAAARAAIRANVESLGLTGATRLFRRDATGLGIAGTMAPFDLVFVDPPYAKGLSAQALVAAYEGGWLSDDAVVVVEAARDAGIAAVPGLTHAHSRRVGASELQFFNATAGGRNDTGDTF
ncbi:MAG: 16S rRNA (guanine(966)-N(2))-methyltransferase RsmD [Alphaproteobacteria bacterium]